MKINSIFCYKIPEIIQQLKFDKHEKIDKESKKDRHRRFSPPIDNQNSAKLSQQIYTIGEK